ncbi:hypothetical protein V6N13_053805 [Hibiscus sabdariffa]|uniref:Uncharacterized protein n=1 Tax=Hibiscus sabdariffa TaxID=183260 RepID=A0ABR2T6J1_9ROSI
MCEKIKQNFDKCNGKVGGDPGGTSDFVSSPKSPVSPENPWQSQEIKHPFQYKHPKLFPANHIPYHLLRLDLP